MDGYPSNPSSTFDHQNIPAEFGSLYGRPSSGRAAANNNQIIVVHKSPILMSLMPGLSYLLNTVDSHAQSCECKPFKSDNRKTMCQLDQIKICGLSNRQSVDAIINGGATHMGMIFFEKSPRYVTLEKAAELSSHAGNRIVKVAVTVDADDQYLDQIVERVKPDMLQFHGSETPERVSAVKARYGLPIMKALPVRESGDLDAAKPYMGIVDGFLFDAKPPEGADLPGGNGVPFDWKIMRQFDCDTPYMLSGGLNVKNIDEAIALSDTVAIDVSSGVEISPGEKDVDMIKAFLTKINECEMTGSNA